MNKPTPKELLEELEYIRASLLPDGHESSVAAPTRTQKTQQTSPAKAHASDPKAVSAPQYHRREEDHPKPMNVLPGQQSLFGDSESTLDKNANETHSNTEHSNQPSTKMATMVNEEENNISEEAISASDDSQSAENPFLPKHIKERLEKEKSLYQQEMDAANKLQVGASTTATEVDPYEAIVDELVAQYLPQIEKDLRRRLRENLEREAIEKQNAEASMTADG